MTIDEALAKAAQYTLLADTATRDERRMLFAQIALAAATTAQAMDFHRYTEAWIAMGDLVDARDYDTHES